MTGSLWDSESFANLDNEDSPAKILKKQASELAIITRQVVQANVSTTMQDDSFLHCFDIIAPVLNYSVTTAFCISQPLKSDFPLTIYTGIGVLEVDKICNDFEEFNKGLTDIFKSEQMVSLIKNIIKQSV